MNESKEKIIDISGVFWEFWSSSGDSKKGDQAIINLEEWKRKNGVNDNRIIALEKMLKNIKDSKTSKTSKTEKNPREKYQMQDKDNGNITQVLGFGTEAQKIGNKGRGQGRGA